MRPGRALIRVCLAVVVAVPAARAGELRELYRGARSQAMGGAYVAIADDEQAVYLNPAGLGGIKRYSLHYAVADLVLSHNAIFSTQEVISALGDISSDTINEFMGENIYGQAQLTPTLLAPNLGVSVLVDGQVAIRPENRALPDVELGYQNTNGLQVAYGTALGRRGRRRGELRVGVGAKVLWRRGGYHQLAPLTVLTLNRNTLGDLTGNFKRGVGVDAGLQYVLDVGPRLKLSTGLAMTDIGDTSFGSGPPPVKSNLSWGVAGTYSLRQAKVTVAYDLKHIRDATDWRKKNHIGIEVALPVLSIYGGINQVSLTYGAAFDFFLFRVTAASYAEELGSFTHQDTERRYQLRLAMKINL